MEIGGIIKTQMITALTLLRKTLDVHLEILAVEVVKGLVRKIMQPVKGDADWKQRRRLLTIGIQTIGGDMEIGGIIKTQKITALTLLRKTLDVHLEILAVEVVKGLAQKIMQPVKRDADWKQQLKQRLLDALNTGNVIRGSRARAVNVNIMGMKRKKWALWESTSALKETIASPNARKAILQRRGMLA